MNKRQKTWLTRRSMFRSAAAAAMFGPLFQGTEGSVSAQERVNRNSAPSTLKITDMRACRVAANYDYPLIKIYTNQDVYGLGEVRDAGVEGIALILKAHLVGKNPLNIEQNLRMIRQFSNHGRMGGGYSAVDMALHDIAGKVYDVPAYRLVGNKTRDRVRIYADTTSHPDPKVYAERMRKRREMGLTFFKMDLQSSMVKDRPGRSTSAACARRRVWVTCASTLRPSATSSARARLWPPIISAHSLLMIRSAMPRRLSHTVLPGPKICSRSERGNEYPYLNWEAYKTISDATVTPVLTGEDIFGLQGGFQ